MCNWILHHVANVLGVLIHIDGLPYGRAQKREGWGGISSARGDGGSGG